MPRSSNVPRSFADLSAGFVQRVRLQQAKLKLVDQDIVDAPATIAAALAEEWLMDQAFELDRGVPLESVEHPLGNSFQVGGPEHDTHIIELAGYLRQTAGWTGYHKAVQGLKTARQYRSTLLQFASAIRIARAGGTKLELEPAAGSRVSDIGFSFEDRRYLAECYVQTVDDSKLKEVHRLGQAISGVFLNRPGLVDVAIALRVRLDQAARIEVHRAIRRLAAEAGNEAPPAHRDGQVPVYSTYVEWREASVSLTKTAIDALSGPFRLHTAFITPEGLPDEILQETSGPMTTEMQRGLQPTIVSATRVLIWLIAGDSYRNKGIDDHTREIERLANTLEKQKLRQTKGDGAERLLIVETPVVGTITDLYDERLKPLRRQILEKHPSVAGILLLNRWFGGTPPRWRYEIRPVLREYQSDPLLPLTRSILRHEGTETKPLTPPAGA